MKKKIKKVLGIILVLIILIIIIPIVTILFGIKLYVSRKISLTNCLIKSFEFAKLSAKFDIKMKLYSLANKDTSEIEDKFEEDIYNLLKKKLVLYFGSFNPPHTGHLSLIKFAKKSIRPDKFLVIISPQSPDKQNMIMADEKDRVEMMKLTINRVKNVEISDIEFNLPKPGYTINTIDKLRLSYPKDKWKITILMGEDNFNNINKWKDSERLQSDCSILVYPRTTNSKRLIDISSSSIRSMGKEEFDKTKFITKDVKNYIKKHKLYGK